MGTALGREERAEEVLTYINATTADLRNRTADIPAADRPRVYIGGVAFNGAHGFLSTDPAYAPFMLLGADNVAAETGPGGQVMIDREKLIEWNPDVIFVDEASAALVADDLRDPVFQSLDAIENGRVYGVMPYNWYANNYDTVLADAYFIGKTLYPERFTDVDPVEKADEIYRLLDGGPAYEGMQRIFGGFGPFAEVRGA
jgi:iron complex transport system substrate-binding protein